MVTPNRPSSRIWLTISAGKRSSCSSSEATGMTSWATNRRTVSTISSSDFGVGGSVTIGLGAGSAMDENRTSSQC